MGFSDLFKLCLSYVCPMFVLIYLKCKVYLLQEMAKLLKLLLKVLKGYAHDCAHVRRSERVHANFLGFSVTVNRPGLS